MARTLDRQEPTFWTVKVTPTHSPPVSSVKATDPFCSTEAGYQQIAKGSETVPTNYRFV